MPLEATMICVDNSEWMRNGDHIPTRLDAQQDAANLVSNAKTQQNPENTVGVLSMAGAGRHAGAKLLASPTDDMGKILASLHDVKIAGKLNFLEGVQVAQLALKHRRNKNGGQRIVLFVGSPIDADSKSLVKAGKLLKKNNVRLNIVGSRTHPPSAIMSALVLLSRLTSRACLRLLVRQIAVDVISMGENEENADKLQEFVDTVNSSNNSNLITIPPGVMPSDVLISSPVIQQDMGGGGGGGGDFAAPGAPASGGGGGDAGGQDFGGVDPNLDPELAMALRVSMEEERARQEAATKTDAETKSDDADGAAPAAADTATPAAGGEAAPTSTMEVDSTAPAPAPAAAVAAEEEEELLQQALAMSMHDSIAEPESQAAEAAPATPAPTAMQTDADEDDEAMQLALQMSLQASGAEAPPTTEDAQQFHDPEFVNRMLASLPGVDPSDPQIQAALQRIGTQTPVRAHCYLCHYPPN